MWLILTWIIDLILMKIIQDIVVHWKRKHWIVWCSYTFMPLLLFYKVNFILQTLIWRKVFNLMKLMMFWQPYDALFIDTFHVRFSFFIVSYYHFKSCLKKWLIISICWFQSSFRIHRCDSSGGCALQGLLSSLHDNVSENLYDANTCRCL